MTTAASPALGGHRRSLTSPVQVQSQAHDRGGDIPDEPDEILFEHPKVDVYTFSIPGKLGSPYPSPRSPQSAGNLPWRSPNEQIIGLDRPLRLRRPKTGAPFLQAGSNVRETRVNMMPNTEMWCVDGRSKFATCSGQSVYRIQFPLDDPAVETSIDNFKNALMKIIRYEPTDVPCPFKRESKAAIQTQDDSESPQRRPKRTLIGPFEDLKKSPSHGAPSRRHSEWIQSPSHLQFPSSNDTSDDDEDPIAAVGAADDQTFSNDAQEETPALVEETVTLKAPNDSGEIQPISSSREPKATQDQAASLSTAPAFEHEHDASQGRNTPLEASDTSESNASPQVGSSPVESPAPSSDDGLEPDQLAVDSGEPTIAKDVSSDDEESSASGTSDSPLDMDASESIQDGSSMLADIGDPNSEYLSESAQQDQTRGLPPSDTPTESLEIPNTSTAPAAAEEEPSSLRLRTTTANPAPSEPNSPPSTSSAKASSPRQPNRRTSASDPNTYILSKLIDLLTSPPSKFFGALLELLRLISDRAFGGVVANVGSGVVGTLRLPRTPGRWVDSEEDSEADEGGDADDVTAASEDEWDSDAEEIDDYGVPLGNGESARLGRQKIA